MGSGFLRGFFRKTRVACRCITLAAIVSALVSIGTAHADWTPERGVELVVGAGPGGGIDITARILQNIFQDNKILAVPVTVVNKAGGGGAVAWSSLAQRTGDGRILAMTVPGLVTNNIRGISSLSYSDVTPIVQLLSECTIWTVHEGSSIRTGRNMLEQLRKDPASLNIAVGLGLGGPNHLGSVMAAKAAGIDFRKLKFVVLKSSSESITAILGGHVDVVASSPLSAAGYVRQGKLRAIASSSVRRLAEPFSDAPTWTEMGIDVTLGNWRGVVGPKGMTADQVAFWEKAFRAAVASEEWKASLKQNLWENAFLTSAESRMFLEKEERTLRGALADIGATK